jgi:hypothetical protein
MTVGWDRRRVLLAVPLVLLAVSSCAAPSKTKAAPHVTPVHPRQGTAAAATLCRQLLQPRALTMAFGQQWTVYAPMSGYQSDSDPYHVSPSMISHGYRAVTTLACLLKTVGGGTYEMDLVVETYTRAVREADWKAQYVRGFTGGPVRIHEVQGLGNWGVFSLGGLEFERGTQLITLESSGFGTKPATLAQLMALARQLPSTII